MQSHKIMCKCQKQFSAKKEMTDLKCTLLYIEHNECYLHSSVGSWPHCVVACWCHSINKPQVASGSFSHFHQYQFSVFGLYTYSIETISMNNSIFHIIRNKSEIKKKIKWNLMNCKSLQDHAQWCPYHDEGSLRLAERHLYATDANTMYWKLHFTEILPDFVFLQGHQLNRAIY